MTSQPLYLITTADERTWKFDRPVLFLGYWCLNYERRSIWQKMDALIAEPYGLQKKNDDVALSQALQEQLLETLHGALNDYHRVNYSKQFWQIVVGHWLRVFVNVIINRVQTLSQCIQNYPIAGVSVVDEEVAWTPTDYLDMQELLENDQWNSALYIKILNLTKQSHIPVEVIRSVKTEGSPVLGQRRGARSKARIILQRLLEVIARCLPAQNVFILNSYLPRNKELELHLALGVVPRIWDSPESKFCGKVDRQLRSDIAQSCSQQSGEPIQVVLQALLFELLPVSYLEGFAELTDRAHNSSWPVNPKLIFTCNNFCWDDVFKIWAASKQENGACYVVGQHGNNYGTSRYMFPSIEEKTADVFITWGWQDGLRAHVPGFILKKAGQKAGGYSAQGGLLLVEWHCEYRQATWDTYAEFEQYFAEQQDFVRMLDEGIRRQLTIRLHSQHKRMRRGELERWELFDPEIRVEAGSKGIADLIAQSRLVVHSYDSTGILETLALNIPTMAFWQDGMSHLRESAKPFYSLLAEVGIIHFSTESITNHINEIWDDVDGWWKSNAVQKAREEFCKRYAKLSEQPIKDLKHILLRGVYENKR